MRDAMTELAGHVGHLRSEANYILGLLDELDGLANSHRHMPPGEHNKIMDITARWSGTTASALENAGGPLREWIQELRYIESVTIDEKRAW